VRTVIIMYSTHHPNDLPAPLCPECGSQDRIYVSPAIAECAVCAAQWDVLTPACLVEAMRAWALECDWLESREELEELSPAELLRGVEAHYAGGVAGFVRDAGL
jgi:hypothetical protein